MIIHDSDNELFDAHLIIRSFRFNLNKNNLKVKTQNLLNFSSNGGTFKVSQELIGFVKFVVDSGKDTTVILDKNDIPVRIDDTKKFLEDISSLYFESINEY